MTSNEAFATLDITNNSLCFPKTQTCLILNERTVAAFVGTVVIGSLLITALMPKNKVISSIPKKRIR